MTIALQDMTWPEVHQLLCKPNVVLIPVGSTEQHGHHLPLSVDSRCAEYIAEKTAAVINARRALRAVVAPAIHYTDVTTFESFPGTVGISLDTEIRLIADIARSFIATGFHSIVFVNGHFSNIVPLSAALRQVNRDSPDAGLYAVNWWDLGCDAIAEARQSPVGLHADEIETAVSLVVQPENVQMDKSTREVPTLSLSEKWVNADLFGPRKVFYYPRKGFPRMGVSSGVIGDGVVASVETGRRIVESVVANFAELIMEIVQSDQL